LREKDLLFMQFDKWEHHKPHNVRDHSKCLAINGHCGRSPISLTVSHWPLIVASTSLFVRKIDPKVKNSLWLVDALDYFHTWKEFHGEDSFRFRFSPNRLQLAGTSRCWTPFEENRQSTVKSCSNGEFVQQVDFGKMFHENSVVIQLTFWLCSNRLY
jgi:hypothetical protein